MSRTRKVNLDLFDEAKAAADAAAEHYGGLAEELALNAKSLHDKRSLDGGFGITGHFQNLLAEFGREWLTMLNLFVADERAFAQFLKGFSARLEASHVTYRNTEQRIAKSFDDIALSMDRVE